MPCELFAGSGSSYIPGAILQSRQCERLFLRAVFAVSVPSVIIVPHQAKGRPDLNLIPRSITLNFLAGFE
jgi:hypothetical protein